MFNNIVIIKNKIKQSSKKREQTKTFMQLPIRAPCGVQQSS
jgi:hypothetical protein